MLGEARTESLRTAEPVGELEDEGMDHALRRRLRVLVAELRSRNLTALAGSDGPGILSWSDVRSVELNGKSKLATLWWVYLGGSLWCC